MSRRVRCKMCGELAWDTRTVYVTPAVAPGVDVPGAKPKRWQVCRECYGLLVDDDTDEVPHA